jgi:MFS family permease
MRLTATLIKSTIVAALGGFLFGFDTAVISGTTAGLKSTFHLSDWGLGLTVAIAVFGTIPGAAFAGIPGDRYGRRDSLRVMAILYLISALGCGFAWNWGALLFFRFIGGLGVGGSSVLGPMYIAEIAPAKWRGRLVGVFQVNIVIGILLAYLSNDLIGTAGFGANDWRWMLGVSGVPALFFFIMLFTIPRSPRWLMQQNRREEARTNLCWWESRMSKQSSTTSHARSTLSMATRERRCSAASTRSPFSWQFRSRPSTSCPASTPFFIT